jgi:cation diffusion facilitator family transporter
MVSIAAALITIGLKFGAYALTGSVGLLSDALESVVNLATALFALFALTVADRPADEEHAFGHGKAEYFSSGFEGALILVAAVGIAYAAFDRFLEPRAIERAAIGLTVSVIAAGVNLLAARYLLHVGRKYDSITLEADARHLMTDVWSSAGVVIGVGVAAATGWQWLDPVVGLVVATHIVIIGGTLIRRSAMGLLDTALPTDTVRQIEHTLSHYESAGMHFHALRTRQAGRLRFVSFHVLVPGHWTVQHGHDLLERIESDIRERLPGTTVFTHLEPLEDPASFADQRLDRR